MILNGMGDVNLDDILSNSKDLVTAYNQEQILQANIDRAKQGLPPIDTAKIAPTYNIGLSPEIMNLVIMGGLLILVVVLMSKGKK